MKVIRILIYDGDERWMLKQLGRSLADGTRMMSDNTSITAITIQSIATIKLVDLINQINTQSPIKGE